MCVIKIILRFGKVDCKKTIQIGSHPVDSFMESTEIGQHKVPRKASLSHMALMNFYRQATVHLKKKHRTSSLKKGSTFG
jgi:hypothetical protein